jgi:RNA polymerase sigma factor (sigma-70 family)
MNEHNEAELVKQAQQGDRESYGRLVDRHSGSVLAITYSRVGNFAASEDIAQDAFLMGFEKLASLRRPQLFGPWLRTITANLCHRWHRTRAYRSRLQEDRATLCERLGYDDPAKPNEMLERNERATILHKALEHLGVNEREALLLYYFESKSVNQAAAAAGVSAVAMRKRLQRARDRLRDVLSAEVEAELNEAADRRKLSTRVLAAIPFGASFAKIAPLGSVIPSTAALATKAVIAKAMGASLGVKLASGVAAMILVTAMALSAQIVLRSQPIESAQETPLTGTAPTASTSQPMEQMGGQAASGQDTNALAGTGTRTGTARISGTITTADGGPLKGAKVEVILRDPSADTLSMKRDVAG